MKKAIFSVNILIMCLVFIGNYFFLTVGGLLLKGLSSAGFALMGIINLCYALYIKKTDLKFNLIMAIGLTLAMLGDIFLGVNFILGAGLFALGHICYLLSFCTLLKIEKLDLIISGIIALCAEIFIIFCPLLDFGSLVFKFVCIIYALIISCMVGKAISNYIRQRNTLNLIIMIGAALFFISDLMLVLDWFMNLPSWSGKICMAAYYPAECLLALSSFIKLTAKKE